MQLSISVWRQKQNGKEVWHASCAGYLTTDCSETYLNKTADSREEAEITALECVIGVAQAALDKRKKTPLQAAAEKGFNS